MVVDLKIKSEQIVDWIAQTIHSAGFNKVVIGLSGGIDSAVSATLAVKALGKDNVIIVMLPYGSMSDEHVVDAMAVADFLAIPKKNKVVIDIKKAVDVLWSATKNEEIAVDSSTSPKGTSYTVAASSNDNIRLGNIMARIRMIYLFDLAKKFNALVCGTENKTEHNLGYFTRFGDSASDLEPIVSLYKTDVRTLAKSLQLPEKIIIQPPTAGLWKGQTDEGELGFTYADADKILSLYIDQKLSKEAIIAKGIPQDVVTKVIDRVKSQKFKHNLPHQLI